MCKFDRIIAIFSFIYLLYLSWLRWPLDSFAFWHLRWMIKLPNSKFFIVPCTFLIQISVLSVTFLLQQSEFFIWIILCKRHIFQTSWVCVSLTLAVLKCTKENILSHFKTWKLLMMSGKSPFVSLSSHYKTLKRFSLWSRLWKSHPLGYFKCKDGYKRNSL